MYVLAIETSCDDTAIALIEIVSPAKKLPIVKVLKSVVSSQTQIHAPFGGVVPTLAKREHIKNLPIIWKQFLKHPIIKQKKVDLMAVTVGPGLEPALWTGIVFARELHEQFFNKKIPLLGANHLEGHLYSFVLSEGIVKRQRGSYRGSVSSDGRKTKMPNDTSIQTFPENRLFPMISLIVSGGHTILGVMKKMGDFKKLGETKDDAVGESFDKVARLLGLPYPGGPQIESLSKSGDPHAVVFPSPMLHQKNYDFSYSGLKTAVLYYMRDYMRGRGKGIRHKEQHITKAQPLTPDATFPDIAASFQNAAYKVLVKKTLRAVEECGGKSVSIGGGVAASKTLRGMLVKGIGDRYGSASHRAFASDNRKTKPVDDTSLDNNAVIPILVPPFEYCMDNAVMIAVAGYMTRLRKKKYALQADGTLTV